MPKGVYQRKPASEKLRKARSEASRNRWASLTEEQRVVLGAKISASLTGKSQSEAHRKANSEGHKRQVCSDEIREKLSAAGKMAYAEGRKVPSRSGHRKGIHYTDEAREKIWLARQGQVMWNTGKETGPRSQETKDKISAWMKAHPNLVPAEKKEAWKANLSASLRGRVQPEDERIRRGASLRKAYQEGRKTVSVKSWYGKGCYYESPFQGTIWLRSSSELQRARELDLEKAVWFYEAKHFPVVLDGGVRSYTPDFWVIPDGVRESVPNDYLVFLNSLPLSCIVVEDVKGWWGEKHKTYRKIQAFIQQYPEVGFNIVLRRGLHGNDPVALGGLQ